MSLREEQCKKICRILDDVLANRPTERDSLIVAVQLAFESLSDSQWIPVTERLPKYGVDCLVTVKQKYPWQTDWEYFVDLGWRGSYIDSAWETSNDWDEGQETHISAWMPLPEHYNEVTT